MKQISRRTFLQETSRSTLAVCGALAATGALAFGDSEQNSKARPNILFAIADDWGWPYASINRARGIKTPAFDSVARSGCLFTNAFIAAPQCSPNRASILTGRPIWQLEEAGTHASIFPKKFTVFTDILEQSGYAVGFTGKAWGPGDWKSAGWTRNPAGPQWTAENREAAPTKGINSTDYAASFEKFLAERTEKKPFFFWYGAHEPHRLYEPESGLRAGKKLEDVDVPPFLPDNDTVRSDLLDYFVEIEWFDSQLGKMLAHLDEMGELENTLVVVTSDNGMPFPRAKANLHEFGTHVPLAMQWPGHISPNQKVDLPVSAIDLAPTFLTAGGLPASSEMKGLHLLDLTGASGTEATAKRDYVLTGRERHSHARYDDLGYPARAIRTKDYLYIRNFKTGRWPAGDPPGYEDIDASPTKTYMIEHQKDLDGLFELAFAKRPEEELYDIKKDPGCLHNLAQSPEHEETRRSLSERLTQLLTEQKDPRVLGTGDIFDSYPRMSAMRKELGGFAEQGKYNPAYQPKP
jgi:uncharacterized sulfatase